MMVEEITETEKSLAPDLKVEVAPFNVNQMPVKRAAIIVAHPDDETLWAGGMILMHPEYQWYIATLCRKSDPDRSPKFFQVLQYYRANGSMADLDDGPRQDPLPDQKIQQTLLQELPPLDFEILLTHAPDGEYTRHLRHEEVSRMVMALWQSGKVSARELWMFAYEDDHGRCLPRAIEQAHHVEPLPEAIWQQKYHLITEVYGFSTESWEARATPKEEAFWRFDSPAALQIWLDESGSSK